MAQRDNTNKVVVKQIPAGTTEAVLKAHFAGCGDICDFMLKAIPDTATMLAFVGFSTAAAYESALKKDQQPLEGSDVALSVAPKASHVANANPTERRCFRCNQTGHMSSACPSKGTEHRTCVRCGQRGHLAAECTKSGGKGRRREDAAAASGNEVKSTTGPRVDRRRGKGGRRTEKEVVKKSDE